MLDKFIQNYNLTQVTPSASMKRHILEHGATATFPPDLLEVDATLWGCFWQGDVISPGYMLPAVELALLRATELDETWPRETTVSQYLADLRQAITHPQAMVQVGLMAAEPCALIISPPVKPSLPSTLSWYCNGTGYLHAGFRANTYPPFISISPNLTINSLTKRLDEAISHWRNLIVQP